MNTPTPWRIHDKTELTVVAQNNRTVANTGTYNSNIDSEKVHNENVANAELIVRAVNYHDRLVDMVEQLRADLKAARSALYIVGRLQEAQINSKSIQYSEQLLTEIKESK